METTAIRLKQIMSDRNLRQVDIIRLAEPYCKEFNLKLTKSDMSQFVSGKVEPGQWKLSILGKALNVSEVWLMGYDVPMERTEPAPAQNAEREEFVKLFFSLSPENRQRILDLMKALLSGHGSDAVSQGKDPASALPTREDLARNAAETSGAWDEGSQIS